MTTTGDSRVTVLKVFGDKGFIDTSFDDLAYTDTIVGAAAFVDIGDDDNTRRPLIALVRFAPGTEIPPHYHSTDYCSVIVAGEMEITRKRHGPGSLRIVKKGTAYGPLVAGPEGATAIEIFADRTGIAATWLGDDKEWQDKLLAAQVDSVETAPAESSAATTCSSARPR